MLSFIPTVRNAPYNISLADDHFAKATSPLDNSYTFKLVSLDLFINSHGNISRRFLFSNFDYMLSFILTIWNAMPYISPPNNHCAEFASLIDRSYVPNLFPLDLSSNSHRNISHAFLLPNVYYILSFILTAYIFLPIFYYTLLFILRLWNASPYISPPDDYSA